MVQILRIREVIRDLSEEIERTSDHFEREDLIEHQNALHSELECFDSCLKTIPEAS